MSQITTRGTPNRRSAAAATVWALGLSLLAAVSALATAPAHGAQSLVEPTRSGLPWPSGVFTSSRTTRALETWRGRPFDVETLFFGTLTWQHMISSAGALRHKLPDLPARLIVALGMVPVDHWGKLEECAAGQYDPLIRALTGSMLANGAAAAAAAGRPVLIRLGWESNAVESGYPWQATGDGTSWRLCFRRWIDILNPVVDATATPPRRQKNFLIVWNMANRGSFKHPIDNLWPGDDYVDIVASQFYDRCPPLPPGNEREWTKRLTARDNHGNPAGPLAWLAYAKSKGKPYAMPEWGIGGPRDVCGRPGVDNPYFIQKMHGLFQTIAPDLAFESYFNGHGFTDDSKGTHKLFSPDPAFPDPGSPGYLDYAQRYHPQSAAAYRELWSQDLGQVPPEVSVMAPDAAAAEGDAGATPLTFTVTRTGNPGVAVSVDWRVEGGTADAADFAGGVLPSGTVSLAAGETSTTVTVMVQGDTVEEADETFAVTLANATGGAVIGTASVAAAILNDDREPAVLAVAARHAVKAEGQEGGQPFTFAVTRSGSTRRPVSVGWRVAGGSADTADFTGGTLPSGTVAFAAGQTTKTVTVHVQGDTEIEPDETFDLTLLDPSDEALIATGTATGTIRNDDFEPPVLTVTPVAAVLAEGHGRAVAFTFRVTRTGDRRPAVGASWQVEGAGADAADFVGGILPSGTVTLGAWQTTKTVTVQVQGDRQVEADEGFALALLAPTGGASIGGVPAPATILNDDVAPPVIALASAVVTADEGNAGATAFAFRVTRSGDPSRAVAASWRVRPGSADAADFAGGILPSGTVAFAAGETEATVTVPVQGDSRVEPDETFSLTLASPTGGAVLGAATTAATIRNDDAEPATLSLAPLDAVRLEGHGGPTLFTFAVTRSGDPRGAVGATWSVTALGADAADFVGGALPAGTVSLAAGETSATITVQVQGDRLVEPDEAFGVVLSAPAGGAVIGIGSAQGTILADDAAPAELAVRPLSAAKPEGNRGSTAFTFVVTRSGDTRQALRVDWTVQGIGRYPATAADFAGGRLPAGSLRFAPGETRKVITVQVAGDRSRENPESFAVVLGSVSPAAKLRAASAQGTILNDDR